MIIICTYVPIQGIPRGPPGLAVKGSLGTEEGRCERERGEGRGGGREGSFICKYCVLRTNTAASIGGMERRKEEPLLSLSNQIKVCNEMQLTIYYLFKILEARWG